MSVPPDRPVIYHIPHVDNLPRIIKDGNLYSDSIMTRRGDAVVVGMQTIKARRLVLPVACHHGDSVGDFVPFYFCPRSVMLFLLTRGNHPELHYKGGQGPIVHLEADLKRVVRWANQNGHRWAFSLSNAGARIAEFRNNLDDLKDLNWEAIGANDWRDQDIKEAKQAEFLVHGSFPFRLFDRIGVSSEPVRKQCDAYLKGASHKPIVAVIPKWYY